MSENTKRSYKNALNHFESKWGGSLPAGPEDVARYLSDHASVFSHVTLRIHLSAIKQWHLERGLPTPTKAPIVRHTIRDICQAYPPRVALTPPLQLPHLEQVAAHLDKAAIEARDGGDQAAYLRHVRDKALVLVGFWFGFTSEALCRLEIRHMQADRVKGLTCFLPKNSLTVQGDGTPCLAPALPALSPIEPYLRWIDCAAISDGAVFRGVSQGGKIASNGMHTGSVAPTLRKVLARAGIPDADQYDTRSLRTGFANWALSNGWDTKTVMDYIGWKHEGTAIRHAAKAAPLTP